MNDNITNCLVTSESPSSPILPAIIDCHDAWSPSAQRRIIVPLVVAILGLFIVGTALKLHLIVVIFWVILLATIALFLTVHLHRSFRIEKMLSQHSGPATEGQIRDIYSSKWYVPLPRLRTLGEKLMAQGVRNVVVRIAHRNNHDFITPLGQQFEPVPLNETDGHFAELEQDALAIDVKTPASTSALGRNIKLGGGWFIFAAFTLPLIVGVIESIQKRRLSVYIVQWGILTLALVMGLGKGASRSRLQWYLVPGGVAERRPRFWKDQWELRLFRRNDSILVVRNAQSSIWTAHITTAAANSKASMTRREAHMLLRAWLSPLPTPPVERLSDLM